MGTLGVLPTAEQLAVIDLPPEARVFVVAGPGTGKTWTLLQRAVKLADVHSLHAGDLLVLSFTRAVVAELRRRDHALPDSSRVRPETFDSFATRLLGQHTADEQWRTAGFDGRIVAACQVLESGAARSTIETIQHVLLDEVQDLVGVRAQFVAALLRAHKGGFTAFGDPAQAIYDHERDRSEDALLDLLGDELAEDILELRGNHRATGKLANLAAKLRPTLIDRRSDEQAVAAVLSAFGDLQTLGPSDRLGPKLGALRPATAVLCRDNASALLISDALHRDKVAHRVRRGTSDRPVAGWVAALFDGHATLTEAALRSRHAELVSMAFPALPDPDFAWQALTRMDARARTGAVRESEVRGRIALGGAPWQLYDEPPADLVLSSIHHAKGLEFERCVIVEWSPRKEHDQALEARVLFVALTRARKECWHAAADQRHGWYRARDANNRFIRYGRERWQTFGIEVLGGDVHAYEPGGDVGIGRSPAEIQDLLLRNVRSGDLLTLEYTCEHDFGRGELPMYAVIHSAHGAIGVTGAEFGEALRGRLRRDVPAAITGARIDDLETVAGSPDVGDSAGLGRTGLWLRPRLVGLGEFQWAT